MNSVPLLAHGDPNAVFAWRPDGPVSVGDYLADATALAERLPAAGYLLNLCHDRYHFAVGFAAGLLRGMTSLQPSSQSAETFRRLHSEFPDLFCLCDGSDDTLDLPRLDFPDLSAANSKDILPSPQRGEGPGERGAQLATPQIPADQLAAILFTSGATGVPKGVEYQHRHFLAQIIAIRAAFRIQPGEVDLPTFPPFALFDPALGMTSVIPDMDPTRPGSADPVKLVNTIEKYGVTTLFASPALVDVLAQYGASTGKRLTTVKRVISAGAPVTPKVVQRLRSMLPDDAQIFTPYGATECLPVCAIEGREILALAERTNRGEGICVGKPLPANQVRLIKVSDEVVDAFLPENEVVPGGIGEIVVCGPTTTEAYFARATATRLAKIRHDGRVWHRMGDVGYFDAQGRLWYVGRKVHRVETGNGVFYPEIVEGVFNAHPRVRRTALVGVRINGKAVPGICVELAPEMSKADWKRIRFELRDLALRNDATNVIRHFWRHPGFPVDIRHNAKIDRIALAQWAGKRADKADLGLT